MRLIDADREIERYARDYLCPTPDVREFEKRNAIIIVDALKKMKTVEVRPKGKWIDNTCSICGHTSILNPYALVERNGHVKEVLSQKSCSNCGADMRGEE